jgi:hypothetical protein
MNLKPLLIGALACVTLAAPVAAQTQVFPSPVENPITTFDVTDHMISGTTEAGEIGTLGWNSAGTSVGLNAGTPTADRPGIRRLNGSANTGNVVNLNIDGLIPASFFDLEFHISLPSITAVVVRVGYSNQLTTSPPSDGIYWEFDSANIANWAAVTRASSDETLTDSGVAAAVDTWVALKVRRASATSIQFYLNGVPMALHTDDIPTAAGQIFLQLQTTENVTKNLDIDKVRVRLTNLAD